MLQYEGWRADEQHGHYVDSHDCHDGDESHPGTYRRTDVGDVVAEDVGARNEDVDPIVATDKLT